MEITRGSGNGFFEWMAMDDEQRRTPARPLATGYNKAPPAEKKREVGINKFNFAYMWVDVCS